MRFALCVEYDGRAFCGFQTQPSGCGVQDALERALTHIAGAAVSVVAAGRTDSGVHATAQLLHFDVAAQRPLTAWTRGVNALLPPSIAILWAQPVDDAFHASFAAVARHYTYLLLDRPQRPGLWSGRVGWYHRPLDVEAMREAAAGIVGTHDFSAYRAAECQARSPVRTLHRLDVARSGALVRLDFSANAFLHHMVRNIVGALVAVGAHAQATGWPTELLAARDRTRAAPTFAPDGLYFTGADYDARFGLPSTWQPVAL